MLTNQLSTEFSIDSTRSQNPVPDFCKDVCYNYFSSGSGQGEIAQKLKNTRVLYINNHSKVYTLVLKSSFITYWGDVWQNKEKFVVDPGIVRMNLQNNLLQEFKIEEERRDLEFLDLSSNSELTTVYLPLCPSLRILKLNKLPLLESVFIGSNRTPEISRVELINSRVPAGLISGIKFSNVPGYLDLTGATTEFNDEDLEVLEFLRFAGYTVIL